MKTEFFPMSHRPDVDPNDHENTQTVIIFDEDLLYYDFGFFHFDDDEWYILGGMAFEMKCWCYVPKPINISLKWALVKHFGYR